MSKSGSNVAEEDLSPAMVDDLAALMTGLVDTVDAWNEAVFSLRRSPPRPDQVPSMAELRAVLRFMATR